MDELAEIRLLMQLNRTSLALERLLEQLSVAIDNDEIYRLISICHIRLGNLNKANEFIQKACTLNPTSFLNLNEWAGVEYRMGNDEKALEILNRSLKMDPAQSATNSLIATIYMTRGNAKLADKYAQNALAIHPENVLSKNVSAFNKLLDGKQKDAKLLIDQALAADPNHIFSLCNLALYKTDANEVDEALAIVEKAMRQDPNNKLARQVIKKAICSKNPISRFVFRINNYAAMNRGVVKSVGMIIYFAFLIIGLLAYVAWPIGAMAIALIASLSFYIIPAIPFYIIPQFNKLIIWKHPFGKFLMHKQDIISSYCTAILFGIGLLVILKFVVVSRSVQAIDEIILGLFLIHLSSLPFGVTYIKGRTDRMKLGSLVAGLLLVGTWYLIASEPSMLLGGLFLVAAFFVQITSNRYIMKGVKGKYKG